MPIRFGIKTPLSYLVGEGGGGGACKIRDDYMNVFFRTSHHLLMIIVNSVEI